MTASETLYERALKHIPWGTQTNAKRPILEYSGTMPYFIERAKGCRFWDVDGDEYIDYRLSLGPVILGYGYPSVDAAVKEQLEKGVLFSMASPVEIELAEAISRIVPSMEMVRFGKNGVDANASNLRIARAYSGKDKMIRCGYNGYHDWFSTGISGNGVPRSLADYVYEVRYGDVEQVESILKRDASSISCILSSPYDFNEDISGDYPRALRKLADEYGVILIFDEVLTGFRLSIGGAQEYFGVRPDLSSFAKAVANGFPLSVFGGKRKHMQKLNDFVITATYAGEALSIAAAIATLKVMEKEKVHEHIYKMGRRLMDGFTAIAKRVGVEVKIGGFPVASYFLFDYKDADKNKKLHVELNRELYKERVFVYDRWFMSFSHKEADIDLTLERFERALKKAVKD